jgi:hypothetical protein
VKIIEGCNNRAGTIQRHGILFAFSVLDQKTIDHIKTKIKYIFAFVLKLMSFLSKNSPRLSAQKDPIILPPYRQGMLVLSIKQPKKINFPLIYKS